MKDLFRFIGEDGSLGYVKGEVYMLEIWGYKNPVIKAPIIEMPEGYAQHQQIPYSSWNKFLENWERI